MFRKFFIVLMGAAVCLYLAACGGKNETNLVLNKTVVASSIGYSSRHHGGNVFFEPAFVVDGDQETYWRSNFRGDPDPGVAWIYVDLGGKIKFQTVKIFWADSNAEVFSIEVSDDAKTWTAVTELKMSAADFKENKGKTDINLDKPVEAGYVKVNCQKCSNQYGYSIFELEIY